MTWGLNALKRIALAEEYCDEFYYLLQVYRDNYGCKDQGYWRDVQADVCRVMRKYEEKKAIIEAAQDAEKKEEV